MATAAEQIPEVPHAPGVGLRALLTHRSFSRLWRAMLVSSLGDWVGFVAVAALVARLGGGAARGGLAVAGVMLARLSPSVLFGPFAGVFTDRFDRRKLMISADVSRGVLYGSMPFMPNLWSIFLLSFVIECLSLLWTPAKDASIPNMVTRSQLANANSISLVTTYGTLPVGGAIFTALVGVATALGTRVAYFDHTKEALALWLDAVTFLFSARMVWGLDLSKGTVATRIRRADLPKLSFRSAIDEARDGYRFLAEHPLVRAMTIGIVMAFAGVGSVVSLGPVFARYQEHAGASGFGYLIVAFGIGMGGGMALMNALARLVERDKLFYIAMLLSPVCLFLLASQSSIGLAALFAVPMGVGVGLTWVTGYTLLQENVEDQYRGRTFATLTITARMALFLALVAFPALAAAFGTHHGVHIGGWQFDFSGTRIALYLGGLVVVMAGFLSRRGLKRFRLTRPRPLSLAGLYPTPAGAGVLIAFEGVEGAGKGTQVAMAADYVRSKGHDVLVTREPGGTSFGDRLRETLLDPATGRIDARAEALLFAAGRAQLVTAVIRPALAEGKVVICDRFVDSSIAYQGVARGLGEQDVTVLNDWATQGLIPDLVVLLHLEPEAGLSRAGNGNPDRIESEDIEFHGKVADGYLRLAEENPGRFTVVDANGSPQEVHARVRGALDRVLTRDAAKRQERR
jgi:dTMP kinase